MTVQYAPELCAHLAAKARRIADRLQIGIGVKAVTSDFLPTLIAIADQLDAARELIDEMNGVDATDAFLQLHELGRLQAECDAARTEVARYRSLGEHYELCARAYKRIRELDAICRAHPALADPVGNAAEMELMEVCGKLVEYAKYIRTHTEDTP